MNIAIFTEDKNKFLYILEGLKDLKIESLYLLSTSNLENKEFSFGKKILRTKNINNFENYDLNYCIFDVNKELTNKYIYNFIENDCIVLDCSGSFINDKEIPTIIYEINKEEIKNCKNKNIINIPSSSTIQLSNVLNIINKNIKINKTILSTYQATSSISKDAMDELYLHTKKIYENSFLKPINFKKQIPFNVVPQLGDFVNNELYEEEYRITEEVKKLLKIKVNATCVVVPTFTSNCQSINIEFENKVNIDEVIKILRKNEDNIRIINDTKNYKYATPKETATECDIFVSRIRKDYTDEKSINIWTVADNLIIFTNNIVNIIKFLLEK